MKRIIICLAMVLCSVVSMAQAWRLECAEVERDDRHYEVFLYRVGDSLQGYYLGLDTPDRIPGSLITFDLFTEVCVYLGETLDEAQAALEGMKALADEEVGTMKVFPARMALGNDLKDMTSTTCTVQKRLLGGHRLCFSFEHSGYTTENFLRKGDLRSLLTSLKIYRKLHPKAN
jgi:hypothetical protein